MTENQFDEFFRKKLGDYSSKVPEDMWQRIKQKKDRDRTFVILLLLLLIITGGATSYFIFSSKETANANFALSQKRSVDNSGNKTLLNKKHETITTQKDSVNLDHNNNSVDVNATTIKNGSNSETVGEVKRIDNKSAVTSFSNQSKKEIAGGNSNVTNLSQQNVSANNADSLKSNFSNKYINPDGETALKNAELSPSTIQKDSLKKEKNNKQVYKVEKNNHSPIINNIFIEAYASPDIPVSRTSGNSAYLQHKDSTSNMQLSYTFGVRVGALIGEHLVIKAGLQYSQVNEKFNYTKKNATRAVPVVVQRTLPDANSVERTVLDTSTLIQVGSQYKLNYNHYKSFDLPLIIGYETAGERYKASFNTGIILNIKTTYKGDILDSSLNAVDVNSKNFYKSNTGMSLYFGLGLSTKLNNNFQLFTEPYIRYRLSNMTHSNDAFTQKINVGGLSFGLRYNF